MKTVHTLIFTLLIPGTVGVGIPWLLVHDRPADFELGWLRWLAWPLGLFCVALLGLSILDFLRKGDGSPAIWFTRRFSWLWGAEPDKLILDGFYRFSRNPMYIGAFGLVLAEAIWFESWRMLAYAGAGAVFSHLIVVFVEEPHLRRKHGAAYEAYCRRVPRWFW